MKTITTSFIAITSLFIFWFLRPPLDYVVKAKKPDSHPPQHTISIKKDKANAVSVKGNQTTKPHSGVLLSSGEDKTNNTALVINSTLLDDILATSTVVGDQSKSTTTGASTQVFSTTTSADNSSSATSTSATTTETDAINNDDASTTRATTTDITPTPLPTSVNSHTNTTTPVPEITPTPTQEIKPTPVQTVAPKEEATTTAGTITNGGKNFLNFLSSFLSVEQTSVSTSNPYYFKTLKPETTRILLIISGLFALLGLLFITPRRDRVHFKHYAKQQ